MYLACCGKSSTCDLVVLRASRTVRISLAFEFSWNAFVCWFASSRSIIAVTSLSIAMQNRRISPCATRCLVSVGSDGTWRSLGLWICEAKNVALYAEVLCWITHCITVAFLSAASVYTVILQSCDVYYKVNRGPTMQNYFFKYYFWIACFSCTPASYKLLVVNIKLLTMRAGRCGLSDLVVTREKDAGADSEVAFG